MTTLRHTRCRLHPEREAAARCPRCQRHFCRECVTEHEGAVYCLACLEAFTASATAPARRRAWASALAVLSAALLIQWGFFLLLLRPLANLTPPASASTTQGRP